MLAVSGWFLSVLIGSALLGVLLPGSDLYEVDINELGRLWEIERVSSADPSAIRHDELKQKLEALGREFPGRVRLEEVGRSVENREIYLVTIGTGPERILFWSQMHGDEPTATRSLLDLFQFLGRRRDLPWVERILEKFTLLFVPMLNPDGASRNQRRNAQGIDINRDARALQTPEGRLLKSLRDRYRPFLGFNLHNQNASTTVGGSGRVATIALLAVATDLPASEQTPRPSPLLAKQVTAVLYEALAPFAYGHVSRYDESFNPRAFGDNLTLWGTPIVLIESGGIPRGQPSDYTVKLNFVGILAVLDSLATGRIANANPAVFDSMRRNSEDPIFDLLLRDAWIFTGTGVPLFRGDLGIRSDARGGASGEAIIGDLGDLGVFSAHEILDCSGMLVTPGLIAWDPAQSLLSPGRDDTAYLRRGILTLMETLSWSDAQSRSPAATDWRSSPSRMNWGFVVDGGGPEISEKEELRLAEWMAAGARAWVRGNRGQVARQTAARDIPSWFNVENIFRDEAALLQVPGKLEGDIVASLARWTGQAARRLRLGRRGVLAPGAPADMVIWKTGSASMPGDLGGCFPYRLILNGRLADPTDPGLSVTGRFLGR